MPKLTPPAQLAIVHALARFEAPAAIAQRLRQEFGAEVTPQLLMGYNPAKKAGQHLGLKLRTVFWVARLAYLNDTAAAPDEGRSVRLRALQAEVEQLPALGQAGAVVDVLRRAMEECGLFQQQEG